MVRERNQDSRKEFSAKWQDDDVAICSSKLFIHVLNNPDLLVLFGGIFVILKGKFTQQI